jgi:serine/threonine protein kinase
VPCWNCGSIVPEGHRFCVSCGRDSTRPKSAKESLIGTTLVGKYLIESMIGSGAMGTIYKAEQTSLGKTIVIKVLHKHLLNDPELIQRFHREARAASRLNHPNCVQITDFGTLEDGALYIAMEYIPGIDLATLLEREFPLDHRRLIAITKQICQGLDEAHANGVLHRDLKPENIMIEDRRTARDHVKVVDFGIAKLEENNPNSKRSFQTRTGIVCGTPEYMSPEQARGHVLDPRSDIYALGVMLYHLVTNRLPFEAASPIEVVSRHISDPPIPPSMYRGDLPEPLERLILTMMEKDRENRPASVMDVYTELERIDRELAIERRERHLEKEADDATMVDMRPISELVAAIDAEPRLGPARTESPSVPVFTKVPPRTEDPQSVTTDQTERETLARAAPVGSSAARAMSETIQDAASAEAASPTRTSRAGRAPSPKKARLAAGIEPISSPRIEALRTSAKELVKPDAPLMRENITVESSAVETLPVDYQRATSARSGKWWIIGALIIAIAMVVLSLTVV